MKQEINSLGYFQTEELTVYKAGSHFIIRFAGANSIENLKLVATTITAIESNFGECNIVGFDEVVILKLVDKKVNLKNKSL